MINTKGEWIYTNSEIAYELGLSPATVNAIGKKLYGNIGEHERGVIGGIVNICRNSQRGIALKLCVGLGV